MKWQPAFGTVLKRRRERVARLTQEEMAEAVGRHIKTIAKWEQGRQMPHDGVLLKVIAAVRAEPEEFLQEVTSLVTRQLLSAHDAAGHAMPRPVDPTTTGAGEVQEGSSERWLALAADSPARSIRPELEKLHLAIDDFVVVLVTSLKAPSHR